MRPASLVASLLLAASLLPTGAEGQVEPAGWSAAIGAGAAFGTDSEDAADTGGAGLGVQLLITRERAGRGLGLFVQASWLASRYDEKRHLLALLLTLRPAGLPVIIMGGAGVGVVTIIDVEGPPPPPGVGDVVIGIGDQSAAGLALGVAADLPLSRHFTLEPALDLIVHRAAGRVLGTGLLGGRIRVR